MHKECERGLCQNYKRKKDKKHKNVKNEGLPELKPWPNDIRKTISLGNC